MNMQYTSEVFKCFWLKTEHLSIVNLVIVESKHLFFFFFCLMTSSFGVFFCKTFYTIGSYKAFYILFFAYSFILPRVIGIKLCIVQGRDTIFFLKFKNWGKIFIPYYISFRYTTQWFDICILQDDHQNNSS